MKRKSGRIIVLAVLGLLAMGAAPAEAQRDYEPLFDKFNFRLEGSWVALSTEIRLDSKTLGEGTTLNFEDDLNLGSGSVIPSLAFEWQIARKHRLGVRWQDISRDSNAQALTEIQWGDEVIPIDADITLSFATTQAFIDYTYYPWVKERWAMGFGLGFRVMDISSTLTWEETTIGGGEGTAKGTAPLPYLYFEYRRLFSDHWRFVTGLGWLYVKIGDIEGGQWIGRASIEYLVGERWGFGAALNLSTIGVDWAGDEFLGRFEIDVNDISIFARIRF